MRLTKTHQHGLLLAVVILLGGVLLPGAVVMTESKKADQSDRAHQHKTLYWMHPIGPLPDIS
ncbi:hypothetical protein [Nitrosomonas mobilis]|uniref:Uncharacterized protein n=1 Tax=Nitrosomonas mobilis TaxID=51642 RepID=A0A1G5SB26_9PROT|nr:hypothetical protein [Nitrosomonas mobilis]SCZ84386.1 exported hypothetical protein [Nitrosomonas mobilis]HNO76134.1 hypothetical protein [Nitrosomonas mobilis]